MEKTKQSVVFQYVSVLLTFLGGYYLVYFSVRFIHTPCIFSSTDFLSLKKEIVAYLHVFGLPVAATLRLTEDSVFSVHDRRSFRISFLISYIWFVGLGLLFMLLFV